jgi:hypothetical protein
LLFGEAIYVLHFWAGFAFVLIVTGVFMALVDAIDMGVPLVVTGIVDLLIPVAFGGLAGPLLLAVGIVSCLWTIRSACSTDAPRAWRVVAFVLSAAAAVLPMYINTG